MGDSAPVPVGARGALGVGAGREVLLLTSATVAVGDLGAVVAELCANHSSLKITANVSGLIA